MNSVEIKAPTRLPDPFGSDVELYNADVAIFLAGSIENGFAQDWQKEFVARYPKGVLFFNPRRDDWDATWDHNSDQFNEQVNWEFDMLDDSDIIVMYFDPNTKSPIGLLELALHASQRKLIVCCPDGYWRQGNVRVVCERYNIPFFTNKEDWYAYIDKNLVPSYV
jgi:hypothetical protein